MRISTIYLIVLRLLVLLVANSAPACLFAAAQEASGSTAITNGNRANRKSRPEKDQAKATWPATAQAAVMGTGAMPQVTTTWKRTGRCDPTKQEQADLSGTYIGKVNYPDASLTGDATLTITGNNFTMTAGSTTQSGRITAVTTCGYTGATMMFGDLTPPAPSPHPPAALPAVSLRVRKMGDRVTFMTVRARSDRLLVLLANRMIYRKIAIFQYSSGAVNGVHRPYSRMRWFG